MKIGRVFCHSLVFGHWAPDSFDNSEIQNKKEMTCFLSIVILSSLFLINLKCFWRLTFIQQSPSWSSPVLGPGQDKIWLRIRYFCFWFLRFNPMLIFVKIVFVSKILKYRSRLFFAIQLNIFPVLTTFWFIWVVNVFTVF